MGWETQALLSRSSQVRGGHASLGLFQCLPDPLLPSGKKISSFLHPAGGLDFSKWLGLGREVSGPRNLIMGCSQTLMGKALFDLLQWLLIWKKILWRKPTWTRASYLLWHQNVSPQISILAVSSVVAHTLQERTSSDSQRLNLRRPIWSGEANVRATVASHTCILTLCWSLKTFTANNTAEIYYGDCIFRAQN